LFFNLNFGFINRIENIGRSTKKGVGTGKKRLEPAFADEMAITEESDAPVPSEKILQQGQVK
jgi:hypothetical protein